MNRILHLDVLLSQEEDQYVAHCLQLDLVATAKSSEEVRKDIIDIIKTYLEYAYEYDKLDNLFVPAPPEAWEKFFDSKSKGVEICLDRIELSGPPYYPSLEVRSLKASTQLGPSTHGKVFDTERKMAEIGWIRLSEGPFGGSFGRLFRHDRELRKMAREAKMDRWREELEELAECPDKTGNYCIKGGGAGKPGNI